MALMLMQKGPGGDATVTVCHSPHAEPGRDYAPSRHPDRGHRRAKFLTADMVQARGRGDRRGHQPHGGRAGRRRRFRGSQEVAGRITPVPGGVGPLTVAMLLHNTLAAARMLVGAQVQGRR